MPTTTDTTILRGGEFLLQPAEADGVFTPEKLTEEHLLIGRTAEEFVENEVLPKLDQLEQKDWTLARELVKKGAELGLLGVDVPEAYGGLGLDKVTSLVVSERLARSASFGATFGAHANLTIVPLMLFGTDAQKQRYLPRLLSGEIIGAYGLSESGSGSDALGARTKATRQADGSFLLNGEKMWITNGGFADLFVVFAKVDGEQFTAFLVERGYGVKSGKEEHKMGLQGSSTTPLIFQDVRVPAENVLGEVGKGHKVAFNVLNFARFKLGAMCSGGAASAIAESAKYAATRRQFGQPIASFGAIKHKIGEMVVRTYAIESLLYRTAGLVDARIAATPHDPSDGSAALAAFEEYAVESSIAKVAGSEALNFVLDENIQIHGGNGFVRDYPAERHFRDARVNRIFEGTNEINRLLIPGMLIRRAGVVRGVRGRVVDRESRGQRGAELRPRREHPDSRRQRLRPRLSGRAPLPRRAGQPGFRGHQRDQPAADSRHARAARRERRSGDHRRGQSAAGRTARTAVDGGCRRLVAGRRTARCSVVQESLFDGARPRDADVP